MAFRWRMVPLPSATNEPKSANFFAHFAHTRIDHRGALRAQRCARSPACCSEIARRSKRIRHEHELRVDARKPNAQLIGEPHRSEHFGRDVTCSDQRDLQLLREITGALCKLAG